MRIFNLLVFIISIFLATSSAAQKSNISKDFKCFDKSAYTNFDLLKSTRTYGDYEVDEEWSERMTSDKIEKKKY